MGGKRKGAGGELLAGSASPVPGIKLTHKGHSNNRVLVTKKDKLLYKDDYYLENKVSHREAIRLYEAFCREVVQVDFASSWAGVVQ